MDRREASSFRDPHGFIFQYQGEIYRQINYSYQLHYEDLMNSGLYQALVEEGDLIPHQEVDGGEKERDCYKVIKPRPIPFISYPYEWCFQQLKDAALTTLKIQKKALEYGLSLKDASAFNIQFFQGRPLLLDTLSFEKYPKGRPWIAYQQFCQHFLAPLALMAYRDLRLNRLFQVFLDGIPLDLASSLLPRRTILRFSLLTHLHLQARSQKYWKGDWKKVDRKKVSLTALKGIIQNLEGAVHTLKNRESRSSWSQYYENLGYTQEGFQDKKEQVARFLKHLSVTQAWDLGANTGVFSRLCEEQGIETTAFDLDPLCVEKMYQERRPRGRMLPLVLDLKNPTPGLGWNHKERMSLVKRGPVQLVLFLALIHHLALGNNNLPLSHLASFLQQITHYLIIEFVPLKDERAQLLVKTKEEPLSSRYSQTAFKKAFLQYFQICKETRIKESQRQLYLMKKREESYPLG